MKKELIYEICKMMSPHLSAEQNIKLEKTLNQVLTNFSIPDFSSDMTVSEKENNTSLINQFLSAKSCRRLHTIAKLSKSGSGHIPFIFLKLLI